ncbi:unnamed protein product [Taenia asiatica]|uniref:PBPe domain-containing protein n=1 Tax=Taenia asiatica TaxID=60517 RepID=A0A0R3W9A0_TAEAS|nr:unnamed protein product [Taenia asiatica]
MLIMTVFRVWIWVLVLASHLESSIHEAQVVWGGIGGLFRNRFNESLRNPCINNGNAENLKSLTSLYNTGVQMVTHGCNKSGSQFDGKLKRILEAMKNVSDAAEQKLIVSDTDRCTLQNSFLSKTSLKILSKSLVNMFPAASPDKIYLSEFLVEIATISNRTGAQFYSTTMEAITAYAPPVRNSMSIKFLQNVDSTIATICSSLLQQKRTGITFIYDDSNKLVFLIRLLKNVYFSTIYLPSEWKNNDTIKDVLIKLFQNTDVPQTYVLLFRNENSDSYTEDFLELAMLHQQLREGIQIILFSIYTPFYDNGTGFSIPVMETLAFLAKINYEVVLLEQKSNEPYYAEMLKAIVNHKIDVGFTPVPLSTINTEKVSSSSATLTISFTLVRQRPSRPADFLLLLRPLSLPVWLASVVLAFIFTGLLMVFGHLKPVIMRNLAEGEMTSKRDLFEVSALGVASTFSLTKLQIIPTTLSSRIFALLMWMFSYLLLVFYASAMMTILLRIRKPSNAGITVDEVLNANSHLTLIVIKNGIGYESIIGSLNNNSKSYTSFDSIQAAYDALMKDDKTVLLASSIEASCISVMNCALEMVPYTRLYEIILSFPYYKPWTFGPQLDYYFSIISNSGTLTSAASVYFETGRCYQPNYNVPTPSVLELGDSASIYIFLLIGIIVSFIIMGLELLVKHIVGEREAKELTLLVPGRQYTAKIISIKYVNVYDVLTYLDKVSALGYRLAVKMNCGMLRFFKYVLTSPMMRFWDFTCLSTSILRRNGVNVNVADRPEVVFIPNSQLHTDPLKVG